MHQVIFHAWLFWSKSIVELLALLSCFHYIEWFVQHWLIHTKLNDFVVFGLWKYNMNILHLRIKVSWLNVVYYIELISKRWIIIRMMLNYCYYFEWPLLHWMICTTLNDLCHVGWFILRWMIWTTLMIYTTLNDFCNVINALYCV